MNAGGRARLSDGQEPAIDRRRGGRRTGHGADRGHRWRDRWVDDGVARWRATTTTSRSSSAMPSRAGGIRPRPSTTGTGAASRSSGCPTCSCPASARSSTTSCRMSSRPCWPPAPCARTGSPTCPSAVTGGLRPATSASTRSPDGERWSRRRSPPSWPPRTASRSAAAPSCAPCYRAATARAGSPTSPASPWRPASASPPISSSTAAAGARSCRRCSRPSVPCAPWTSTATTGFTYYCRHFRATDGSLPPMLGPPLQHYESLSFVTIPADDGHWSVGVMGDASDTWLHQARRPDVWSSIVAQLPAAGPLDRRRADHRRPGDGPHARSHDADVVDGHPVVTGLVAIGDAAACHEPGLRARRRRWPRCKRCACATCCARSPPANRVELAHRWHDRVGNVVPRSSTRP